MFDLIIFLILPPPPETFLFKKKTTSISMTVHSDIEDILQNVHH